MKIKEPLQGIKTLNGHFIMHVAMFIVSFSCTTILYTDPDSVPIKMVSLEHRKQITDNMHELYVFYLYRWSHLFTAVILLVKFYL